MTERPAFYALALHFTELVLEVPQAIGLVLYPKLAALPEEQMHRLTAQSCRRSAIRHVPLNAGGQRTTRAETTAAYSAVFDMPIDDPDVIPVELAIEIRIEKGAYAVAIHFHTSSVAFR